MRVKCGGMEENIGDMKIKNRVVVFLAELNKAPEMEVNVDDKFELGNFKSIVAYKK